MNSIYFHPNKESINNIYYCETKIGMCTSWPVNNLTIDNDVHCVSLLEIIYSNTGSTDLFVDNYNCNGR